MTHVLLLFVTFSAGSVDGGVFATVHREEFSSRATCERALSEVSKSRHEWKNGFGITQGVLRVEGMCLDKQPLGKLGES